MGAVFFAVASALVLFPPPAGAAGPEWRIESVVEIADQNHTVEGPIVVAQGGVLTIRNATVLFNQTIEGGLKLHVLAGGSLTIINSTLRSSDDARALGLHWNFLVSGHLDAHGADISDLRGDAGLGGLEAETGDVLIEDSRVHHNRYYGIMLKAGAAVVRNTTFEANVVAVFVLPGASPRLEGLTIRNSTSFGLKANGATPVVRNLTVEASTGIGLGASGGIMDVVGCRITGGEVGIDAVMGTTGGASGCHILSVGTGVRAQGAPLRVADSSFFSMAIGVNATSAAVVVTGNRFTEAAVGVRVAGSQGATEVGEGTFNNFTSCGVGFEIYVPSFYLEGNTYAPCGTGTRVFHTMELQFVEEGAGAAVRAKVEIHAADGAAVFAGLTNDTGAVLVVLEEFREFGNGSRQNMTPHAVRVESGGRVTQAQLNATSDRAERFTLANPPPPTVAGLSREGLLLLGLLLGGVAAAGALTMVSRRRRKARAAEEKRARGRRRRGPRAGR